MLKISNNIITGIDLGTTKVCTVIARVKSNELEILGIGLSPSRGIDKGVITDFNLAIKSIKISVAEAQLMSGYKVNNIYAGMSGGNISSEEGDAMQQMCQERITKKDIVSVIEEASRLNQIPQDQKLIHRIPTEYKLDNQIVENPLDMICDRFEVKVHLVTVNKALATNVVNCISKCKLNEPTIVLESIASSQAVINEDEKKLGVILLDIGGGSTDITIFKEGSIIHTAVIPLGGKIITKDIAQALHVSISEAERIKLKYGGSVEKYINKNDMIDLTYSDGTLLRESKAKLVFVIQKRLEDIFESVEKEIQKSKIHKDFISSGIVITGGCSHLKDIDILAKTILENKVRIGVPQEVSGLKSIVKDPIFSTAVGLVLYAANDDKDFCLEKYNFKKIKKKMGFLGNKMITNMIKGMFD
jgi:cell division protein FtsA